MSGEELGLWLFDWTEDRQSDFRLILASRELLAALSKAVDRQGFTNDELISAREVIRKATGK